MATEFVRVKDKVTRHESSVPKVFAEARKNALEILADRDAVDRNGRPLAAKPYKELAKAEAPTTEKKASN